MFILNAVESVLLPKKVNQKFLEYCLRTTFCTFVLASYYERTAKKTALIRKY
jgi:hypothetical protein